MATTYKIAPDIENMAKEVIKKNPEFSYINMDDLVFVRISKHLKAESVLGQCVFLSPRTQFLAEKTYMMEFPPVFDTLNDKQKYIVVEHELTHIPADGVGLVQHDIGEFRKIVEKYGLDWFDTYKNINERIKLMKQKEKLEKKENKNKDDEEEQDDTNDNEQEVENPEEEKEESDKDE